MVDSLGILEPSNADPLILERLRSKIGFLIDGYNRDSRELFQIPEVRNYFQKLQAIWPYGLYFFSRECNTLQLLVLCNIESKIVAKDDGETIARIPTEKVYDFLEFSIPAISTIAQPLGWHPRHVVQFMADIALIFGVRGGDNVSIESIEERRSRHQTFINSQEVVLVTVAQRGYHEEGRGGVLVFPPEPGQAGCQAVFANQERLLQDEQTLEVAKLVERYDPESQFVVCIFEPDSCSSSSYIIKQPVPQTISS
jgi:hypothetical protein